MLILSLAGVGAMYVFLTVEFVALVQFLVYGGAVTVLILLALMLTRMGAEGNVGDLTGSQGPFAAVVAAGLAILLTVVAIDTAWPGDVSDVPANIGIDQISQVLFEDFGAAFILIAAVLLVAFIGAIIIARQEDDE
jgi:NADH-quinone oxidoreductase subunit J